MIPRILHHGAFGSWAPTTLNEQCRNSWGRVLPDWNWQEWSDQSPIDSRFFQSALRVCPINAHNYFLLYSVWKHGGYAVDNDIDVVRPFELDHGLVVGFQTPDGGENGINDAVIGGVAGHPVLRRCLDALDALPADFDPLWCGPGILTQQIGRLGIRDGNEKKSGDVMVYDRERFYPFFHDERHDPMKVTHRTFAVHHWQASWSPKK